MHSQQPPGVVQNWSTLQCSKQNTEQCGYDHAPVTRGRMRAQFPLPHGPTRFNIGLAERMEMRLCFAVECIASFLRHRLSVFLSLQSNQLIRTHSPVQMDTNASANCAQCASAVPQLRAAQGTFLSVF